MAESVWVLVGVELLHIVPDDVVFDVEEDDDEPLDAEPQQVGKMLGVYTTLAGAVGSKEQHANDSDGALIDTMLYRVTLDGGSVVQVNDDGSAK